VRNSIFFIVTLVMTSVWLHRHRKAGGHCTPARAAGAPGPAPSTSTLEGKNEMPVQPQGEYQYPVANA
jgi:hypothetical protein